MRSYLIDEIPRLDMQKINEFLKKNAIQSGLEKIFWVKIPEDILSDIQYQHHGCQPYVFAIELGPDWVKLEFLIRNLNVMKCTCSGYSTHEQRDFIFNYANRMIKRLDIHS